MNMSTEFLLNLNRAQKVVGASLEATPAAKDPARTGCTKLFVCGGAQFFLQISLVPARALGDTVDFEA